MRTAQTHVAADLEVWTDVAVQQPLETEEGKEQMSLQPLEGTQPS